MRARHYPLIALLIFGLSFSFSAAAKAVSPAIVVTSYNTQGWIVGQDPGSPLAAYGFVTGPAVPPAGVGSVMVNVGAKDQKIMVGRTDYSGVALSSLTTLSYSTFVDPASTNLNEWFLNLYISTLGNGTYDDRLDYVPPGVAKNVWQTWNALAGTWYEKKGGGSTTIAAFLAKNPAAQIVNPFVPTYPGFKFNGGSSGVGYIGLKAYIDNITVGVGGVVKNWDFEPSGTSAIGASLGSGYCFFYDNRINTDCAPAAVAYCINQGIDVYKVDPTTSLGHKIYYVSKAAIDAAGVSKTGPIVLAASHNVTLYRLSSGHFQINTFRSDGKTYVFNWDACPESTWTLLPD